MLHSDNSTRAQLNSTFRPTLAGRNSAFCSNSEYHYFNAEFSLIDYAFEQQEKLKTRRGKKLTRATC